MLCQLGLRREHEPQVRVCLLRQGWRLRPRCVRVRTVWRCTLETQPRPHPWHCLRHSRRDSARRRLLPCAQVHEEKGSHPYACSSRDDCPGCAPNRPRGQPSVYSVRTTCVRGALRRGSAHATVLPPSLPPRSPAILCLPPRRPPHGCSASWVSRLWPGVGPQHSVEPRGRRDCLVPEGGATALCQREARLFLYQCRGPRVC
mmetsp:Transcript_18933/g.44387  ORF Transcript_18933/g.44387 Transcript_18933/m.44387 type:complete len:202 (+) Transcript_18933:1619-2224(+)